MLQPPGPDGPLLNTGTRASRSRKRFHLSKPNRPTASTVPSNSKRWPACEIILRIGSILKLQPARNADGVLLAPQLTNLEIAVQHPKEVSAGREVHSRQSPIIPFPGKHRLERRRVECVLQQRDLFPDRPHLAYYYGSAMQARSSPHCHAEIAFVVFVARDQSRHGSENMYARKSRPSAHELEAKLRSTRVHICVFALRAERSGR
jgi:hypothetical protein